MSFWESSVGKGVTEAGRLMSNALVNSVNTVKDVLNKDFDPGLAAAMANMASALEPKNELYSMIAQMSRGQAQEYERQLQYNKLRASMGLAPEESSPLFTGATGRSTGVPANGQGSQTTLNKGAAEYAQFSDKPWFSWGSRRVLGLLPQEVASVQQQVDSRYRTVLEHMQLQQQKHKIQSDIDKRQFIPMKIDNIKYNVPLERVQGITSYLKYLAEQERALTATVRVDGEEKNVTLTNMEDVMKYLLSGGVSIGGKHFSYQAQQFLKDVPNERRWAAADSEFDEGYRDLQYAKLSAQVEKIYADVTSTYSNADLTTAKLANLHQNEAIKRDLMVSQALMYNQQTATMKQKSKDNKPIAIDVPGPNNTMETFYISPKEAAKLQNQMRRTEGIVKRWTQQNKYSNILYDLTQKKVNTYDDDRKRRHMLNALQAMIGMTFLQFEHGSKQNFNLLGAVNGYNELFAEAGLAFIYPDDKGVLRVYDDKNKSDDKTAYDEIMRFRKGSTTTRDAIEEALKDRIIELKADSFGD